jgi:hypothetical protein
LVVDEVAFGKQVFHVPQTQRKPHIQHRHETNDFR